MNTWLFQGLWLMALSISLSVSLSLFILHSTIFIFSLFIYLSLFSLPLAFYRSIFPILSLRRTLSFSPSLTLYLMRTPFSHAQFFVGFSPRNQSTRGLSSSCLSLSLSSCCRCCSFRHTFSILSGSRSDPRKMEKRIFYFQEISLTFVLAHWAYRHHKLTFWCLRSSDTKKSILSVRKSKLDLQDWGL